MAASNGPADAFESPTFAKDVSIYVDDDIGAASISPSGRDVVLASKLGLRIIDIDSPYSLPRLIYNRQHWDVADVQWSPFASEASWIASTCNQLALIYNLSMSSNVNKAPIEFTLRAHERAITDINFSAHHPKIIATCGVDSYVFSHDLRTGDKAVKFADFQAGATQVKWNRQDPNIIASAHDKYLKVWDVRRGAAPLTTIDAHATKIYGIDWNRSSPYRILTCSLDHTIKLWDDVGLNKNMTVPSAVINTEYPVWRARHTPFPGGILAMPERGNSTLSMYNHPGSGTSDATSITVPRHEFQAHEQDAHVREFLWRARGGVEDGRDNREFQLVSWGTDKRLQLHHINPELLPETVGFTKGQVATEQPNTSRLGAEYITFRDGPVATPTSSRKESGNDQPQRKGNLSTLLQNLTSADKGWSMRHKVQDQQGTRPRTTMTATPIRRQAPRVVNHITWMEGVKVGQRGKNVADHRLYVNDFDRDDKYSLHAKNDIGAEIAYVGNKYKKLTFETVDIPGRRITVSFNGPWGEPNEEHDRFDLVFLRFNIDFPLKYPVASDEGFINPLLIDFEKTTAVVDHQNLKHLKDNLQAIARQCAMHEREALEAVLCYALGERGLSDSLNLAHNDQPDSDTGPQAGEEESSSEEEEHGEFTNDLMQSTHSNANIPLPIQNTVRFSGLGSLVLARMPRSIHSTQLLSGTNLLRIGRNLRPGADKVDIFESFGRFTAYDSDSDGGSSQAPSSDSWESSSAPSSSLGSNPETDARVGTFQPPLAWQKATSKLQNRTSLPSSTGAVKPIKPRSTVSILSSAVEHLIPSKKVLAEEYLIFGDGPAICLHNAEVARKHGFEDLADIWMLCRLILSNEVPLEILPQQHRREQVLVLARRALVRIKRKDSGLDLQFDEADTVTNPKLKGRVKWGYHAVASWLIPALFDHFEREADIQMLAMLSCIFSEPAAREGVPSAMARMRQSNLPMSMEAPAFSLDYFPSAEVAWSLFKPTISTPPTPAHSRYAMPVNEFGWHRLTKTLDTYGSHGSSNGLWGSDTLPSEPVTPYSTGNTPPNLSRADTSRSTATSHTPYSTSPEQTHKKGSTTNFASAVAALSRPFASAISSSPPVKSRTEDLSTSAPTGGVTWGATTFYGNGNGNNERGVDASRTKHGKRASFGQADRLNVDYISDSDSEYDDSGLAFDGASDHTVPLTEGGSDGGDNEGSIKATLKNQDKFDDEGCLSAPLLDRSKEWLHRAWREQYAELLGRWGLVSKRAEVLKFNGLIAYFPPDDSRANSKAASVCLALRKENEEPELPQLPSQSLFRRSTLAATPAQFRPSPAASPKQFSFNPEAMEFKPGGTFSSREETPVPPPDVFVSSEQYLRLSIPQQGLDPSYTRFDGADESRLDPNYYGRSSRPSVSRATSHKTGASLPGRVTPINKEDKKEPIYSCCICWIRVSGRFYLCPSCGHVAHFDCMKDELCVDEKECPVGCGCGCRLEEDDARERMEDFIAGVRQWEESVSRNQENYNYPFGETGTFNSYDEGPYGERVRWNESRDASKERRDGTRGKKGDNKKSEKKKGKKRAIVTGKNYF